MTEDSRKTYAAWWVFLPIGIGLGTAVGALIGNVGLGMVLGTAVGTPFNLAFYYLHRRSIQDTQS